jgi:hypothetical protein
MSIPASKCRCRRPEIKFFLKKLLQLLRRSRFSHQKVCSRRTARIDHLLLSAPSGLFFWGRGVPGLTAIKPFQFHPAPLGPIPTWIDNSSAEISPAVQFVSYAILTCILESQYNLWFNGAKGAFRPKAANEVCFSGAAACRALVTVYCVYCRRARHGDSFWRFVFSQGGSLAKHLFHGFYLHELFDHSINHPVEPLA